MADKTNTLSYWLNWRFFLCGLFVLFTAALAAITIWKYELQRKSKRTEGESWQEPAGHLHEDEGWRTCLRKIHPAWLLAFRVFAFLVLSGLLLANVILDGGGIFFFYTQWTFTLVTVYFGLGSCISIHGCFRKWNEAVGDGVDQMNLDAEQGSCATPILGEPTDISSSFSKGSNSFEKPYYNQAAVAWTRAFQIIYQTCAGSVMLTDAVFWLIIYPFLTPEGYSLDFLDVAMHSVNAVFLLGDMTLNSMRFPVFRVAYFILWTNLFVIFQWILHARVDLWWPYAFMDLSSAYSPLWYLGIGIIHVPSYGIFALIIKLKHFWLSRSFPESYQRLR